MTLPDGDQGRILDVITKLVNQQDSYTTIDSFVIHDTSPFALSFSKGFDRLIPNGSESVVAIYGSLNNPANLSHIALI
jgi:hypothetical protein